MEHVTIDLPGKFDSFFSGSSVGQGDTENYPGAPELYKAYQESRRLQRGKGYSLRLTIPVDERTAGVLACLQDYAETCIVANSDSLADSDARSETAAARMVLVRVFDAKDTLKGNI